MTTVPGPDSLLSLFYDSDSKVFDLGRRETAQSDTEDGSILAINVGLARPSVTGDGAVAVFVTPDYDLSVVGTADFDSRKSAGLPGRFQSVAVSPDAKRVALVPHDSMTGQAAPLIIVLDLVAKKAYLYGLPAPTVAGATVDGVLYAETMTFSADGTALVYDALTQLKFGNGPTVQRWSLFSINLSTGDTSVVVPPQDAVDTGNPAFSRAGSRYLIYDSRAVATKASTITVLDRITGLRTGVITVPSGFGYPSFLGDESGFIFTAADPDATDTGLSLFKQGLEADRVHPLGDPSLFYQEAILGIIYRRSASQGPNKPPTVSLQISADTIPTGGSVTLTATASDPDGTVARVEFYDGSTKLGQLDAGPYVFVWKSVPAGNYLLSAVASDNLGAQTKSSPRFLTVSGAPLPGGDQPRVMIKAINPETVRLTVTGPAGYYIIAMSEDLATWVDIYPITLDASGRGELDDGGGPIHSHRLFYRVRRDQ